MAIFDNCYVSLHGTQIFNTYMNFSRHHLCSFTCVPLFVLDWSMAWNRCLQHPCFKNLCKIAQASKNSDSNAQRFLLNLLTHSWFHSMLFALSGYQFPYIVMNRCLYLIYILSSFAKTLPAPFLSLWCHVWLCRTNWLYIRSSVCFSEPVCIGINYLCILPVHENFVSVIELGPV
jgi:hypothetical protein